MFPPAMDLQRMHFFRALARIAAGCGVRGDLAGLVPDAMIVRAAQAVMGAAPRPT